MEGVDDEAGSGMRGYGVVACIKLKITTRGGSRDSGVMALLHQGYGRFARKQRIFLRVK